MTCPRCGTDASGRFCSNCGATLGTAACATCGAQLTSGAKFCHVCGRATAVTPRALPAWAPWALVGVLTVALLAVVVVRSGPSAPAQPAAAAPAAVPPAMRGPDISQMTPQQRADALYDRIMRLNDGVQQDSIAFFKPMALAAYQMLGELDRDALFHVGMIHAVSGTPQDARAYADSIETGAPDHLFAKIVRWEAADALGDAAARRTAAQAFLRAYETERQRDRPEYAAHAPMLDAYRQSLADGGS